MKNRTIILLVTLAAIALRSQAYDNFMSVMVDYGQKEQNAIATIHLEQAKALIDYVATHKDAPDIVEAQITAGALMQEVGNTAVAYPLFETGFAALVKRGTNANIRAIQRAADGIFRIRLAQQSKAAATDFLKKFRTDFTSHPDAAVVNQVADDFAIDLLRPVAGETMKVKYKAVDGRDVDLASMTGKVVLVDFWATWCGPCVGEMPNVLDAYKKYHDKGFEIVGISLDKDKAALEQFLKEKGIPWPQRFSGDWWEDEVARAHGIRSIPSMFLIGKDGKVAAIDATGEELHKRIAELLK